MVTTLFSSPDTAVKTLPKITVSLKQLQRPVASSSFVPSVWVHDTDLRTIQKARFTFPGMPAVLATHVTTGLTMRHSVISFLDHATRYKVFESDASSNIAAVLVRSLTPAGLPWLPENRMVKKWYSWKGKETLGRLV